MSTVSILLVEDHPGFAQALINLLSQRLHIQVVAVVETAEDAHERLRELEIDLVLVDYSLPNLSGINLVTEIQQQHPDLRCIMLSGHLSTQYARRALEAGARGYLIKDNPAGILEGIQYVLNGGIYLSEELRNLGSTDLLADFT
jgi:DNA-binding NarL/FixJ family response regulator